MLVLRPGKAVFMWRGNRGGRVGYRLWAVTVGVEKLGLI